VLAARERLRGVVVELLEDETVGRPGPGAGRRRDGERGKQREQESSHGHHLVV
jgi:hypothetical protein